MEPHYDGYILRMDGEIERYGNKGSIGVLNQITDIENNLPSIFRI